MARGQKRESLHRFLYFFKNDFKPSGLNKEEQTCTKTDKWTKKCEFIFPASSPKRISSVHTGDVKHQDHFSF